MAEAWNICLQGWLSGGVWALLALISARVLASTQGGALPTLTGLTGTAEILPKRNSLISLSCKDILLRFLLGLQTSAHRSHQTESSRHRMSGARARRDEGRISFLISVSTTLRLSWSDGWFWDHERLATSVPLMCWPINFFITWNRSISLVDIVMNVIGWNGYELTIPFYLRYDTLTSLKYDIITSVRQGYKWLKSDKLRVGFLATNWLFGCFW